MTRQPQPIITSSLAVGALCYLFRSNGVAVWQKARLVFFAVLYVLFVILLVAYIALEKEPFAHALMVLAFSAFLGIKASPSMSLSWDEAHNNPQFLLMVLPLASSLLRFPDRKLHFYMWLVSGVAVLFATTILAFGGWQWYVSGDDWLWGAIAPIFFASTFLAGYCVVNALTPLTTKPLFIAVIDGIAGLVSATLAGLHPRSVHLGLQGCVVIISVYLSCELEASGWPIWLGWPGRPKWLRQGSTSASDVDATFRNSTVRTSDAVSTL